MSQEEEQEDVLHIGNQIGIHSQAYGYTKGRIVYRSLERIRITPEETSDRAVEFAMTEDGSGFSPELGVTAIDLIGTQESPYYVDFLGARIGELLEFFTADGAEALPSGEVKQILKTDTEDSIELVDGRILEFGGVGPPDPIAVIRVRTAINAPAAVEIGVEPEDEGAVAAAAREKSILTLLRSVIPSAAVEIIPTAERTYPDSMQREGLFQDLLGNLTSKKQSNPRQIRLLEREVDLAVALKNKSIQRDQSGRIIGTSPYLILSVSDAVSHGATPSAIPIVQAARVLNLDDAKTDGVSFKSTDVAPRDIKTVENELEENATLYLNGAAAESFYAYTHNLLGYGLAVLEGTVEGAGWSEDQDVIRTASLDNAVQGLSKGLPNLDDKIPVSLSYILTDVTDRTVRVLTTDQRTYIKTGVVSVTAPSDPNHVTGFVMLPPKAALTLRPPRRPGHLPTALIYSASLESDNLPSIAQTLRDLYSGEASPLNAWTLAADAAATHPVADWLNSVLKYTVHPVDSLGPRGPHLLSLLDTLGIGTTDLSPAVADVINAWVKSAQSKWYELMKARRREIQKSLDTETRRTFQSVIGVDSQLWAALRQADSLKELLKDIRRRNPMIFGSPTLMTALLLVEAQGDATPLVWSEIAKLDSRTLAAIDTVDATLALAASRAYSLRKAALRSRSMLELHAEPEINTCVHVARLESIRNVTDVLERARLLRAFIEEFQGAASGDWITCAICKKNCVCYHELLELEALAQPARMEAIQKQILIKYGGDRYDGNIVCKNCGQALQEIDFDEHVEFDDNGKPIQQASVLTEEQMEETTTALRKAMAEPAEVFDSQSHRDIAAGLADLLKHARLSMSSDVFRRIVTYTDIYVSRRAPDEGKYTELLKKRATSAATKFKKTSGVAGVEIDLPTYAETIDQIRVSALIAFIAIAIQSQEATVSSAIPICKFSREGYPFNPAAKPDEPGALLYVACAAADIKDKKTPWLSMSWVGDTKFETRQKKALQIGFAATNSILGVDGKSAALSFTSQVRMELTRVQTDVAAAVERAIVSIKDELPSGFRPEPRPPKLGKSMSERNPLPAIEAALAAGAVSAKTSYEVQSAIRQNAIATIVDLYAASKDSREGMCCPATIQSIQALNDTQPPLRIAAQMLRQTNPTAANTGTHLWPVQNIPHIEPVEQAVDEGVFFKLFLKYCYQGPAIGNPHEFSVGDICRQCGLTLGKPIDFIDFGKDGASILAAQQGPLRIEVTRGAFDALSDAARRRKMMRYTAPAATDDRSGLATFVTLCAARPQTAELATILSEILATPGDTDEMERITQWSPLSTFTAELIAKANIKLKMLELMTDDPFIEGPRALQEYWCAKVQAAAASYSVVKVTGARWFNISTEHNNLIDRILSDNATWYDGTVTAEMKPILMKIAHTLGPLMNLWVKAIRPDPQRWTVAEAQLLLRTVVVLAWHDAVTPTSWMYESIAASAERGAIAIQIRKWLLALMDFKKDAKDVTHKRGHIQSQFIRYSKDAVQRILQQRMELERTSVVEEFESIKDDDLRAAEFIKKQFRIGRWGVGSNLQKYNADLFEFESEQRRRMGIMDAPVEPGLAPVQEHGAVFVEPEDGYAVGQEADGDDY